MEKIATDIVVKGVPHSKVAHFCAKEKTGGYKAYPPKKRRHTGFVHVDTGPVRTW